MLAVIAAAVTATSAAAGSGKLTEFHPASGAKYGSTFQPDAIAPGPNGSMWFWDSGTGTFGLVSASGAITEFPPSYATRAVFGVAESANGNLWFTGDVATTKTGAAAYAIDEITPSGHITSFTVPQTPSDKGAPTDIAAGPGGTMWFTAGYAGNYIGRVTQQGKITVFAAPCRTVHVHSGGHTSTSTSCDHPRFITAGPNGAMWYTGGAAFGQITPAGKFTEISGNSDVQHEMTEVGPLVEGPDGNMWFTDAGPPQSGRFLGFIGRITPRGQVSVFTKGLGRTSIPAFIAAGPNHSLWFTDVGCITGSAQGGPGTPGACALGQITTAGVIDESHRLTSASFAPWDIAADAHGTLWFTDLGTSGITNHGPTVHGTGNAGAIGRFTP